MHCRVYLMTFQVSQRSCMMRSVSSEHGLPTSQQTSEALGSFQHSLHK